LLLFIKNKNILTVLDALANYFSNKNPRIPLDESFINKLDIEFNSLLQEVIESELSLELKNYLVNKIEDILRVTRKYHISGTNELEKTVKSFTIDLTVTERTIKDEDKENLTYQRLKAWLVSLIIYITPSPYDIAGTIPAIYDFWLPKFEELAEGQKEVEKTISEDQSIIDTFKRASDIFQKDAIKKIRGKEIKALPPSPEETKSNKH